MSQKKVMKDGERRFENKYFQGTVEREAKKGTDKNDVVTVANVPVAPEPEPSQPQMGVSSRNKVVAKSTPSKVKSAVAKPVDRKIIDAQTGLNGRLGS